MTNFPTICKCNEESIIGKYQYRFSLSLRFSLQNILYNSGRYFFTSFSKENKPSFRCINRTMASYMLKKQQFPLFRKEKLYFIEVMKKAIFMRDFLKLLFNNFKINKKLYISKNRRK